MKLRSALFAPVVLLAALALAACGPNQGNNMDRGDAGAVQDNRETSDNSAALPPAEEETQAFFGDEAPVIIEAAPEDYHDHDHGHDHGDGSEPHVH